MRAPVDTLYTRGLGLAVLLTLAACGTTPQQSDNVKMPHGGKVKIPVRQDPTLPAMPAAGSGRGGYYKDDGPGDNPPSNLRDVPDAEVRNEPYSTRSNRPYVVFGKTYTPLTDNQPFTQRGTGTWYGKKFHGQRTSSGEIYDMYKMTAAHPTLPIPSYARVTSIDSGEQVIVRINDRGPFHATRVIDVSYTAALKLGFLGKGSHQVIVERLLPADIDAILAARAAPKPVPSVIARSIDTPAGSEAELTAVAQPEITSMAMLDATVAAPAPMALATGFYLQLGAYSRLDNAEQGRAQLAPYAQTLGKLDVVPAGALFRLYGGPFTSRADAARAAASLPASAGVKPIVIER
ncbi:septal ring lytic transglycosylase RlpA family protein [Janthinobacterium sp. PC23-8]|uniref:septal ring lytic transglycosylase RlpA family protein n=1 Tax=Janthinobacterium sp. PC23-8 TaxID=2012679 RepID=UPI000B96437F|nr:septal ring lytic transglycosylase RlpA family protein [Janthinobacterium sp. PC23-8]OYO32128.1 septal ring lytic transglycosylase RlpA family lipoprotein [Janthinobacterium sp. PC23-8]